MRLEECGQRLAEANAQTVKKSCYSDLMAAKIEKEVSMLAFLLVAGVGVC